MKVYDRIKLARDPNRMVASQVIDVLVDNFIELHGDRLYGDDNAIIGGIGYINDIAVTVIGQDKGSDLDLRISKNFGMANPEGFRKALRLMKQAEKFNRPIVTIVDTAGAYPGIGAEERGQGEAIARLLYELSDIKVPVITILLSEGGSGGALALAVNDHMLMFENAFYSVISPEGYATIIRSDKPMEEMVEGIRITAEDMIDLGVADEIIPEKSGKLTFENYRFKSDKLKARICEVIREKQSLDVATLIEQRTEKFLNVEKLC